MSVLVGTSGWQYREWRGTFYPAGVPQRRWLEHHARQFAAAISYLFCLSPPLQCCP
jgi:uncharacterized protein YecE (DUF72 family)